MTKPRAVVRSVGAVLPHPALGPLRRLAVLSLLLASAAHAQPTGPEILADWREGWDRASENVAAVAVRETLDRTVDGPRGDIEMRTEARLRFPMDGPPNREITRAELDGRRVGPAARRRYEARTSRAFGPAAGMLLRPAALPGRALTDAQAAEDAARSSVDGVPAWHVRLQLPTVDGEAAAWFSREDEPRLLRLRFQQSVPRRGRVVYEADYRRVGGLDVPSALSTTVTIQQRRRLRDYTVSLRARGTYRTPEIVRS